MKAQHIATVILILLCPTLIISYIVYNILKPLLNKALSYWLGLSITTKSIVMLVLIVSTVILYGSFLIYLNWPITDLTVLKSGVFGDSFGFLSSLFSGLAFGGLIWTILLQRQDIQVTKDEVFENRKLMARQNFESTFFNLLQMHHRIVEGIDIDKTSGSTLVGRDCFKFINRDMKRYFAGIKEQKIDHEDISITILAYDSRP